MTLIAVTGMSGLLGSLVRGHLEGKVGLRSVGRTAVLGVPSVRADVSRLDELAGAFDGCDLVLHLAAYPMPTDEWAPILAANVVGTYNVLETSARAGVRRFVLASSLSVMGGYRDEVRRFAADGAHSRQDKLRLLEALGPPRPDSLYGASKLWGETLCRLYADSRGLRCVCLRLGEVRRHDAPDPADPLGPTRWCSQRDFLAAVDEAIDRTEREPFAVMSVLSSDPALGEPEGRPTR